VALIVGAISLATSGVYFIMITLAFSQMLYFATQSLEKYGGDDGMTLWRRSEFSGLLHLSNRYVFYYVVLGLLLACVALSWRLVHSRFGMVLQGIRDNERRMQALGFPTYRYKLTGFVMAAGLAGLAGALLANQAEFVSPAYLHWSRSGEMLFMVTLGGMGTLFGPMLGAVVFLLLEEVISSYTPHWKIIFGPLLVLFVLFVRRGLYGLLGGAAIAHDV
jgi:branched-chain amino acid transport system permease protein